MYMKEKIVLLGAGGHCKVIIDALRKNLSFDILGVIDNDLQVKEVSGIKKIGSDKDLAGIFKSGCRNAFIAVGSIGDASLRIKLADQLSASGFILPKIIHPGAIIAEGVVIGDGSFIAAGAVIGPDAAIGKNVIVNTSSSVDHDCCIEDFVHIAPGVTLSGTVSIGRETHIGTGASVIQNIKIGRNCLIGAGAIVVRNIADNGRYTGRIYEETDEK